MLDLHHKITNKIEFSPENLHQGELPYSRRYSGREAISHIVKDEILTNTQATSESVLKYQKFKHEHSHVLSSYFHNIYQLLYSIEKITPVTECQIQITKQDEEKHKYADIFMAQLTNHELILLLFHASTEDYHAKRLREYLVKFEILENIEISTTKNGVCLDSSKTTHINREVINKFISTKCKPNNGRPVSAFGENETFLKWYESNHN